VSEDGKNIFRIGAYLHSQEPDDPEQSEMRFQESGCSKADEWIELY
jgi:hypothetical protein